MGRRGGAVMGGAGKWGRGGEERRDCEVERDGAERWRGTELNEEIKNDYQDIDL